MPGSYRSGRARAGREGALALDGRADRAQEEHLHVALPQLSRVCSIVCEGSGMTWNDYETEQRPIYFQEGRDRDTTFAAFKEQKISVRSVVSSS